MLTKCFIAVFAVLVFSSPLPAYVQLGRKSYGYILPAYLAAYTDYQTKQAEGALVAGGSGGMLRYIPSELQQAEEFPRMLYKPAATAIDMETGIFNF